eukprot:355571-Chlamydomonas_euryale.AAC.3
MRTHNLRSIRCAVTLQQTAPCMACQSDASVEQDDFPAQLQSTAGAAAITAATATAADSWRSSVLWCLGRLAWQRSTQMGLPQIGSSSWVAPVGGARHGRHLAHGRHGSRPRRAPSTGRGADPESCRMEHTACKVALQSPPFRRPCSHTRVATTSVAGALDRVGAARRGTQR